MIRLNIGGRKYATTFSTLSSKGENFFTKMILNHESNTIKSTLDETGAYFVDRNGELFGEILDYLRNGEFSIGRINSTQKRKLITELDFYGIPLPKVMNLAADNKVKVLLIQAHPDDIAYLNYSYPKKYFAEEELAQWINANMHKDINQNNHIQLTKLLEFLISKGWNVVSTAAYSQHSSRILYTLHKEE